MELTNWNGTVIGEMLNKFLYQQLFEGKII
jgi:hypothetical protein